MMSELVNLRCKYCNEYAGREVTGDPAVVCADCEPIAEMEKERDEARQVARRAHYRAKRQHAKKWGDQNADIAYSSEEEKYPWLKDTE